jgi:hypothetical protein
MLMRLCQSSWKEGTSYAPSLTLWLLCVFVFGEEKKVSRVSRSVNAVVAASAVAEALVPVVVVLVLLVVAVVVARVLICFSLFLLSLY